MRSISRLVRFRPNASFLSCRVREFAVISGTPCCKGGMEEQSPAVATANAAVTAVIDEPVAQNIDATLASLAEVSQKCGRSESPRLVAVSKTKPNEMVAIAYEHGQRHFGENYAQELIAKAPLLPSDIQWHFIGNLQSNKVRKLLKGVPNLYVIETVDTAKLATILNDELAKLSEASGTKRELRVFIQVNTSDEPQKSGIHPADALDLARHIVTSCSYVKFSGLMTVGKYGDNSPACFQRLVDCRSQISTELNIDLEALELSMGMSGDYTVGVELGSTSVRVGSSIFGARNYAK